MLNHEILKEEENEELNVTDQENSVISTEAPTEAEIRKALRQITTGKAPDSR
jgi:hypothetical protein